MMTGSDAASPAVPEDGRGAFLRFLLVGGLAAGAYSLITAALVGRISLPPALTSALIWLAFIPPVFLLHRAFTFRGRQARKGAVGLYALTQVLRSCRRRARCS